MENLTRWDSYFDNKKKFKRGRDLYRLRRSLLSLSIFTVLSSYSGVIQASLKHDSEEIKEELSLLMQEDAQSLENFFQDEKEYLLLQKKIEREIDLKNWRVGRLFLLERGQPLIKPHLILGDELEDDTSPIVIGKDVTVEAEETIVLGSHSEADQIGAVAIGFDTIADGLAAVAQGHHAEAHGDEAVAIGQHSITLKDEAIAIGGETIAKGKSSISIGHGAQSNNDYAVAFGSKAIADGNVSVAIGADSHALGGGSLSIGSQSYSGEYGATAIGREAKAENMFSTAIGFQTQATGLGSMALGNNAQAIGKGSVAIGNESIVNNESEVSFGNDKLKRKLVNVAKGEIEKDSTDAINGSQLHATNEQITMITNQAEKRITGIEEAFGAGAKFDDEGVLKQPNYSTALVLSEDQKIVDGVEAGFQYVGKTLIDHDTRINENATNIKNITQGTAGIVKLDNDKIVIDHQLAQGAMVFDLSDQDQGGKSVARKLTGVAIGEVSETSSDAINGSQLHVTNQQITELDQSVKKHESTINNLGDRVTNHGDTINNLGDRVTQHDNHITNLEKQVTQNSGDILQIGDQITTITHQTGKRITGIEKAFGAGAQFDDEGVLKQPNYSTALVLSEDQKIVDGVEAGFQYVGKTLIDHDTRIEANATNIKNITQGTAGIVKLDNDKIVIDHQLAKGTIVFDLSDQDQGGKSVARQLTGVAIGEVSETSSDAINGSQLHATNQQITELDQSVKNHESTINNLGDRVTNHGDTINNLGDRVTQHDNHITNLEKQVTQNSGDILQIGDQITTITHQTGKRITGIEKAFGAGAKFDEEGVLKQPNYAVALALPEDQEIADGVEAGFQYVGETLIDHDTRIEANATNIKNITQGTAGIVKLDNDKIVIDHQLAKGAMVFDLSDQDQEGGLVARKLTGVAIGEISDTSSDAINGSQLHATNKQVSQIDQRVTKHESTINNLEGRVSQNEGDIVDIGDQITTITNQTGKRITGIEEAFGAGAKFDEEGVLKQPNYSTALILSEDQKIVDGVEAGFQYVGKTLIDHDTRINENATNIKNITQGTAGIVKLDNDKIVIDNLLAKGAMIFDFSNSGQNRVLTGIARGKISQNSTDAVNGSQLFEMDQKIEKITNLNHQSLEGVADAFGGDTYVKEGMLEGVDFTDSLKADKPITNVNDGFGYVADRLDDHDKRLDKHDTKLENHENRITHLEGNISNITEGKSGLVQLSEDQKTLVVDNDLGKNADTFDISNSNDERTLTGVKNGQVAENSKDAINGGQLYASNQSIAEMFGGGATIDKEGYISTPEYRFGDDHVFNNVGDSLSYLNSKIQDHGIFSLDREKNQIIIAENGDINQETVINMGNHKVVGVANGQVEKGSLDAVNGGQLWETNQKVVSNSNQIKHINNTLNHYNNRISNLERTVQQNRKVASAGISSAIAMSSIPYSQSNKHSFGMGVGSYDGEAAVSMGVIFNISPDARFKIQGSYDTQNKAGVGVGFSIDF